MVHLQDQFIAVPVSPEVHCKRDDQGQKHAASSTHKAAYQEQQSGQTGQQKGRSDHVCHIDHFLFIDYLFYASSFFFFFCLPPCLNPWEDLQRMPPPALQSGNAPSNIPNKVLSGL
jgi:hypothetical protein